MSILTLCTDFGTRDGYVAAMKGVILSIVPRALVVDIGHEVAPQDVAMGAYLLASASGFFPRGTVHCAVVDPGVGSARRALAVRTARYLYVAPDNGLLTRALALDPPVEVVALENPAYWRPALSQTFHGRDLFAPVAAYLALGVPLGDLGPTATDLVSLPAQGPVALEDGVLLGEVAYVDRFGNLISNVPAALVAEDRAITVEVGALTVRGLSATYADAPLGATLALIGSHGCLEVAVREGSASERARVGMGAPLRVRRAVQT